MSLSPNVTITKCQDHQMAERTLPLDRRPVVRLA